MQYKVPQNIDQEDKILGPLTFTQFVYMLIGGGLTLLEFAIFDFSLFLLLGIPTVVLTICFSLIKIQDQPFSHFFVAFLVFLKQPKRRIWQDLIRPSEATTALGEDFFSDVKRDNPTVPATAPKPVASEKTASALPQLPPIIQPNLHTAPHTNQQTQPITSQWNQADNQPNANSWNQSANQTNAAGSNQQTNPNAKTWDKNGTSPGQSDGTVLQQNPPTKPARKLAINVLSNDRIAI